jgi:hypothetical protein
MKLSELSQSPKLIKIQLDDAETIDEYGESVEFWTYDRQPMTVFVKLAAVDQNNYASVMDAVKELLLDEQGKPIIHDDVVPPARLMVKAMTKIMESLGKF